MPPSIFGPSCEELSRPAATGGGTRPVEERRGLPDAQPGVNAGPSIRFAEKGHACPWTGPSTVLGTRGDGGDHADVQGLQTGRPGGEFPGSPAHRLPPRLTIRVAMGDARLAARPMNLAIRLFWGGRIALSRLPA
jgi:hypothetical protein